GSTENSRLACQITMTDDLDGLMLRIPDGQH
ncbi:MAG: 2Fe-2S ferredoxin, partial [Alphaproteobacteria bacterium HGW-Alphaproteobacteria-12]